MIGEIFPGAVVLDEDSRIYLIKEDDKNEIGRNRWNLPGGSVDDDEGVIESVEREVLEETGYLVEATSLLGCYKASHQGSSWLYIVLSVEVKEETSHVIDTNVKEGRWFNGDDFLKLETQELVHPDMKLVYQIALEKRGLNLESVKFISYD